MLSVYHINGHCVDNHFLALCGQLEEPFQVDRSAELEPLELLLAPRLLVVEHQRQPADQFQALDPLRHQALGHLPLNLDRPQLASQDERQVRLRASAPGFVCGSQDGPRLSLDRLAGRGQLLGGLQDRHAVAHRLVPPRRHRDLGHDRLVAKGGLAPPPARGGEPHRTARPQGAGSRDADQRGS